MTASDTSIDMVTDSTAARKRRPRIADTKTANVQLLQADEEEEDENTDAQDNLDFGSHPDQSGYGAEDDPGGGIGDDRIQAEPLEYAFEQLGDDDHRANGKEGFV